MLKVDLAGSSDEELAKVVAERCSALGAVNRVTVYAARSGAPSRPFAIVAMGARQAAESVAARFEGRTVGNAALVFLEHAAVTEKPPSGQAELKPVPGSGAAFRDAGFHRHPVSTRGDAI